MPKRGTEVAQLPMPPRRKVQPAEEIPEPSTPMDISFCDDEALPPGIVFTDVQQKKWRIGKPIGRGSFGRIYLASDDVQKEVTKINARYVVKIEPHTNGPLFVEVHCLIRTAQADKIKSWRQRNKQKCFGMPVYIASGSFTDKNTDIRYRFLVLPRYDIDLHKIIARTRTLDVRNVLVLAIQILEVLEYLHNGGYTHSDIKSSNLMLGYDGNRIGKVPVVKLAAALQKDIIKDAFFAGKQRKSKSSKSRTSNYYIDEDFIVKDYKSPGHSEEEDEKRLANVKKKLRRILTDKDSRSLHRHHAFNLRQLTNCVNYEDMNSSVCSDQSYQKLLDDFGNKNRIQTTKEFQESKARNSFDDIDETYKEGVLSQSNRQIYLLDYGLASKFLDSEGKHKDFGMDARKAHDGTLEYSSRDSHIGAHSRRSDLETLGYNLLDWLTGRLPWKTREVLAEPDLVHAIKKNFMTDVKLLLKTCFKSEFYPQFMEKYLQYVTSLDFTEKPDYEYCKSLFKSELLKNGNKDVTLNFIEAVMTPISRRKFCHSFRFGRKNTSPSFLSRNGITKSYGRENLCCLEMGLKLELLIKETLNNSSDGIRKPCSSRNFFVSDADLVARLKKSLLPHEIYGKKLSPKNLRSKQKKPQKRKGVKTHRNSIGKFGNFMGSARQFTWAEILAGNPEDIIRRERNLTNDEYQDDDSTCKYRIRKLSNASEGSDSNHQSPLLQKDYLLSLNPTPAMKEVVANVKKRLAGKTAKEFEDEPNIPEGYTPAMIKVFRMKEKREVKEKLEAAQLIPAKKETVQRKTRSLRTVTKKSEAEPRSARNKVERIEEKQRSTRTKVERNEEEPRSTRTKVERNEEEPRSTRTRAEKNEEEPRATKTKIKEKTSCRVTRQKTSTDSIDKEVETKSNTRTKTRKCKSAKIVHIVEDKPASEEEIVLEKKPVGRRCSPRSAVSLPNRRRLRSSKRSK